MDVIHEPTNEFNFTHLSLSSPVSVSSGNHFIKYSYGSSPLYIKTPKCSMKQGVIKAGKKMFCDLMFSIENEQLIQWLENLETHSQRFIFEQREKWFETPLEQPDIENSFATTIKLIKSGKCYTLRASIPTILGKPSLKIYDEQAQPVALENLKENTQVISILEFQGIKCSPRGFQIEIEVKQLLVLNPADIFQKCVLINTSRSENTADSSGRDERLNFTLEDIPTATTVNNEIDTVANTMLLSVPADDVASKEIPTLDVFVEEEADTEATPPSEMESEPPTTESHDAPISEIDDVNAKQKGDTFTEIDFNLEEIPVEDSMVLKNRNDVYYEMYREALRKAKMAKELAISNYLEAKRIKNIYMLNDLSDDETESEYNFTE